ncbi:MAG: PEP-utilizing enzyme [Candidatus Pacebacteria bacterium]|nr:PEP-utilizing enzyme [Candidatus Paceibacterota bacterium]
MNPAPETKWVKLGDRAYLPFSFSLNGSQNSAKYLKKYGNFENEDRAIMYQHRFYWPENEIEKIADYQIRRYRTQGAKYLWSMAKKCEQAGDVFLKKITRIIDRKTENKSEVQVNLSLIIEEYRKFVVFMTIPWVLDDFFGQELNEILNKRNLTERVEIEKKLNQPLRLNEGELEQISLLKIAASMKSVDDFNPAILKKIAKHVNEYGWLPIRWFVGNPLKETDVIERLKHVFSDNPQERSKSLKDQAKKVKKEAEQIIRELGFNEEECQFAYLLKEYTFIRTYRSDLINKVNFIVIPILKKASAELGIPYSDILYLSYGEILECLRDEKKLAHITVLSGKEAEAFATKEGILEQKSLNINEIKGVTAYKGKTSGKVKIVHNPNDISKVEKGDILVTTMTFPSYIAAMERAAAFVTDEGGVLCHAAIVAREMKKPCVIATKIATKAFKDGDMVEVDADTGIVKIIK